MEKFRFEYESMEELAAHCERRKLGINFAKNIDILFESIEIGGRKLGNRLAILPMEGSDATADGKPGELTLRRWKRFATGGAKLIWGEAAAVVVEGRSNPRQLVVNEQNTVELSALVSETRKAHRERFGTDEDLLTGIQLTHAGRHCFENPTIAFHSPVQDRFTFLNKRTGKPLPEDYPVATDDYLEMLEDRFVDAARVARDAGFDFVDIKQCHGYLLNELLAARPRKGKYGGAFRNRRRFIVNVVRKIQQTLGNEILIASRLNAYDGVPYVKDPETGKGRPVDYEKPYIWGWGVNEGNPRKEDLSEPKRLVEMLSNTGVSFFGISAGVPYWSPHLVRPFNTAVKGGYLSPEHPLVGVNRLFRLTEEMQWEFSNVPMVGAGYSWLRHFLLNVAAWNVALGNVTIAGIGRSALAYPDLASDGQKQGEMDREKVCLADSMCSNMLRGWDKDGAKTPTGCPVRDPKYRDLYKLVSGG